MPESGHKQVVVKCPEILKPHRENKKTVCIDEGIVDVIKHLWANNIVTLACCQGMPGCADGRPNVVIENCYTPEEVGRIRGLISNADRRPWIIYQWQLIEVKKFEKQIRTW